MRKFSDAMHVERRCLKEVGAYFKLKRIIYIKFQNFATVSF